MSCKEQTSTAGGNGYQYSHDETATIRLYPASSSAATTANGETSSPPWSLNSRVMLESSSTLHSPKRLFRRGADGSWDITKDATTTGTPFSKQVLELLSRYPLERLLIRVGDAATSSSSGMMEGGINGGVNVNEQPFLLQEERAGGPSGTSVLASFAQPSDDLANEYYQDQYASLLRYLLNNNLFPACGAPLDSVRVRKHGHSTIVHSSPHDNHDPNSTIPTAHVESFLAADGATFCNPGINDFLLPNNSKKNGGEGGWGAAANNGACHSSDTWGLFGSLFSSSSGVALSELLLGTSLDATHWEAASGRSGGSNKRNSVWVDLRVSPSCFAVGDVRNGGEECSVEVSRGASYRIALPSPTQKHVQSETQAETTLKLSLGDLLFGHNTLVNSLSSEKDGWKAWYPCPLSDSSRISIELPRYYAATLDDSISSMKSHLDGDKHAGIIEFDVLSWKDGYIDLTAPLAQISPINENDDEHRYTQYTLPPLFGISRTVQRPLGVSSSGTLVTVLRFGHLKGSESQQSQVAKVHSMDILPGTLMKPRMHTLRMVLYHGGGAGGDRFVPPINSKEQPCECIFNESNKFIQYETSSDQCGLLCKKSISLSELEEHKITLQSDGTVLLERTANLHPDSSLWMMVDFDEAYLPFQKIPADANRGIDAFPSRATFTVVPLSTPTSIKQPKIPMSSTTLYSPSLLLLPPVPDMSMPFNVISLSCTLWAFVFGSLLNILVRRATESIKRDITGEKEERPLDKLKEKIRVKMRTLKEKLQWGRRKNEQKEEMSD